RGVLRRWSAGSQSVRLRARRDEPGQRLLPSLFFLIELCSMEKNFSAAIVRGVGGYTLRLSSFLALCSTRQNYLEIQSMDEKQTPASSAVTDTAASESSSGVAVLDRAFAILGAFGPNDERLTLTELARRTNLYKSTVLRLLAALEHGGFIRKLEDGQYAIGHHPLRFCSP